MENVLGLDEVMRTRNGTVDSLIIYFFPVPGRNMRPN